MCGSRYDSHLYHDNTTGHAHLARVAVRLSRWLKTFCYRILLLLLTQNRLFKTSKKEPKVDMELSLMRLECGFNNNFFFEGRAANANAHSLAKFAHSLDHGRYAWLGQTHDQVCIPQIVAFDQ